MRRYAGLLICCVMFWGCSKSKDVYEIGDDARITVKTQRGTCTDINTYDSGAYWSETWWYWSQGISYTFGKEERVEESKSGYGFLSLGTLTTKTHYANVIISSTYNFNPITAPARNSTPSSIKLPQDTNSFEPGKYW